MAARLLSRESSDDSVPPTRAGAVCMGEDEPEQERVAAIQTIIHNHVVVTATTGKRAWMRPAMELDKPAKAPKPTVDQRSARIAAVAASAAAAAATMAMRGIVPSSAPDKPEPRTPMKVRPVPANGEQASSEKERGSARREAPGGTPIRRRSKTADGVLREPPAAGPPDAEGLPGAAGGPVAVPTAGTGTAGGQSAAHAKAKGKAKGCAKAKGKGKAKAKGAGKGQAQATAHDLSVLPLAAPMMTFAGRRRPANPKKQAEFDAMVCWYMTIMDDEATADGAGAEEAGGGAVAESRSDPARTRNFTANQRDYFKSMKKFMHEAAEAGLQGGNRMRFAATRWKLERARPAGIQ